MSKSSALKDVFADLPLRSAAGEAPQTEHGVDLGLVERWLETENLPARVQLVKLEEFSAILREEARNDVYGELEELIASLEMKIYRLRSDMTAAGPSANYAAAAAAE